uniref:Carboxypeptidase regulatory-like domain-containing protein n=1 Tax=Ignisphaera aggregans TaxID=334771 RepID=A0A7J2U4G3_9CREN
MRSIYLAIVALALLAIVFPAVLAASDPTLTLTFIAPDKTALANAPIKVFDSNGNLVTNATTDASGKATVSVSTTGLYNILAAGSGYYILTVLNVAASSTTATIDASAMYKVDILSTLKSVDVKVSRGETPNAKIGLTTNTSLYTDAGKTITLEFPSQVSAFPYVYKLNKIVYDSTTTTNNTVTIAVNANAVVTAYYEKVLILQVLPTWVLIVFAAVIIIAVGVLAFAPRMAKKVILSIMEEDREFVKRKRFVKGREDEE